MYIDLSDEAITDDYARDRSDPPERSLDEEDYCGGIDEDAAYEAYVDQKLLAEEEAGKRIKQFFEQLLSLQTRNLVTNK